MTPGEDELVDGFIAALLDDDAEQLYEQAPCGYFSTTPDGTVIKGNQTFLSMTGHTRAELMGRRRFVDLLTPGGRIYHETHYAPMLRMQGTVREIALDLVRADGSRLPVLVNSVLERDGDGNPVVIRTAVFDASHRRRYEEELLREKQRAEESESRARALARTLQQTLMPPQLPQIAGLDVAAEYRPAGDGAEVGGDFYDVFQTGDDWVVVLGDVCGKGIEAAVVTALARYTLRAAAVQDPSPAHALTVLNDVLRRDGSGRFCTVAMLRLTRDADGWRLTSCPAGHPLPLRVTTDGAVQPLGTPGPLVGVLERVELGEHDTLLRPGEAVVVYTDGVPDARSGDEFYGDERLVRVLSGDHRSAEAMGAAVRDDVVTFQSGRLRDDMAVVVVRVPDLP